MNKFKRIMALCLAGMLAMAMTACSNKDNDDDDDDRPSKSASDNSEKDDKSNDWDEWDALAKGEVSDIDGSKPASEKVEESKAEVIEPDKPERNEDYSDVIDGIVEYVKTGSVSAVKTCFTDESWDKIGDFTRKELGYDSVEDYFTDIYEMNFDLGDFEVEVAGTSVEEADEYDLQAITEQVYVAALGYDENSIQIDKAYSVEVECYIYDENGEEIDSETEYFTIARVNNKWELTLY